MKPILSYTGLQFTYNVNVAIPTMTPVNTGGAITPKLKISTISGATDNSNYIVDGLPNVATYKYPNSVAVKTDGTLAVVDDYGQVIRIITPEGVSSTFAGKFVTVNGVIQTGDVNATGNLARFKQPIAVRYDNLGNIIVLDTYNFKIKSVNSTATVSTVTGSGYEGYLDGASDVAQFKLLTSLWIDNQGNIFVTDNCRVRKINTAGVVTTIAGTTFRGSNNGNGINASFKLLRGITGDNNGNLYVSDPDNSSIRKIDSAGNVTTFTTGLSAAGIELSNNLFFVSDFITNQIKTVTISGVINVYAGSGVGQFKDGFDTRTTNNAAALYAPEGIAVKTVGNIRTVYVADKNSMKIRKVDLGNYTISPSLPNGLNFDSTTGLITGTPTQVAAIKTYTVTCGNLEGYSSTMIGFEIK